MTVQNYKNKLVRGFTLIELLIVMAILGVLAVVVLVAINPVQQLARTRDAGRTSGVSQIGHAVTAFYTSRNATYPADLAELVTAGELTTIPAEIVNSIPTTECTAGLTGDKNEGWCYEEFATGAVVWTGLEADSNLTLCAAAATEAYAAYSTEQGRGGITCADPTGATVTFVN